MTTIIQSRLPVMGEDHSYRLDPSPGPHCSVTWQIDGQNIARGDTKGGLKVEGIGSSSQLSVQVVGDTLETIVSAIIDCEGEDREIVRIRVGAALPPKDEDEVDFSDEVDTPGAKPGLDPVIHTHEAWNWTFLGNLFGYCPTGCERVPDAGGGISFWPFYYTIACKCGGKVYRKKFSFGIEL